MSKRFVLFGLFLSQVWGGGFARAQSNTETHGKRAIEAVRTELPVELDGSLDEPAWQQAPISLGFVQKDPHEGEPSTENTEFRVLYTPTTLYIGVICYDSEADRILATERRRDSEMENDDILTIVLDTFHDHRNSYMFRTNPLGARYDALVTDEGNDINKNWDEQWEVAARTTPAGWIAEFAIPVKSLRVIEGNGHAWGLDLERVIRRKNEFAYWNGFRRGFRLVNVSQAGHLGGLEELESGLRLRVKAYLLGGFSHTTDRSRSRLCQEESGEPRTGSSFCNASDIGAEVVKYRITPSLTADFTWNTDFAQTEVDDQQVNLDRFPLFFPEKREFFQEGSGIFEFGVARGEGPGAVMKLFHSRQIGLSPITRQPIPIVGGGRITGRVAGLTLGLLNVQTEAFPAEGIPASNYGVARVKRDVFSRSTIGGFLINREMAGTNDFNRVVGADANFIFWEHLTIGGMLARSSSLEGKQDNWLSAGEVGWDSDFLLLRTSWLFVDQDFRDDLGFIPRKNIRAFSPQISILPRPRSRIIRQFRFGFRSDYTMDQNYQLETRINHIPFETRFQRGDVLNVAPHSRLERLRQPFAIRRGVVIPPGTYSWWYLPITYHSNPAQKLSWSLNWRTHWGFFGGDLTQFSIEPLLKFNEQVSMEVGYELNKATFPQRMCVRTTDSGCGFTDHTVNTRINYNFNNQWLTSATIQYNSEDSFAGFNFRLNYIFRPGDDFFLIYNEGRRVDGILDGQKDRTFQAKLTYSFDF